MMNEQGATKKMIHVPWVWQSKGKKCRELVRVPGSSVGPRLYLEE